MANVKSACAMTTLILKSPEIVIRLLVNVGSAYTTQLASTASGVLQAFTEVLWTRLARVSDQYSLQLAA